MLLWLASRRVLGLIVCVTWVAPACCYPRAQQQRPGARSCRPLRSCVELSEAERGWATDLANTDREPTGGVLSLCRASSFRSILLTFLGRVPRCIVYL